MIKLDVDGALFEAVNAGPRTWTPLATWYDGHRVEVRRVADWVLRGFRGEPEAYLGPQAPRLAALYEEAAALAATRPGHFADKLPNVLGALRDLPGQKFYRTPPAGAAPRRWGPHELDDLESTLRGLTKRLAMVHPQAAQLPAPWHFSRGEWTRPVPVGVAAISPVKGGWVVELRPGNRRAATAYVFVGEDGPQEYDRPTTFGTLEDAAAATEKVYEYALKPAPAPTMDDAFIDLRAAFEANDLESFRDALEALDMDRRGLATHEAFRVRSILNFPEAGFKRAYKEARKGLQGDGVVVEDLFREMHKEQSASAASRKRASNQSAKVRARAAQDPDFRLALDRARSAVKAAQEQAQSYESLSRSKLPDGSYAAPAWQARSFRREYQRAVEALRKLESSA